MSTRRRSLVLLLALLCAATTSVLAQGIVAGQGWGALERRISREQALAILQPSEGAPLMITRSRDGRFEVWNYDRGAYLLFVGGALDYWSIPRTEPVSVPAPSE